MDFGSLNGSWLNEGATSKPNELYALENSSFCMRCCWRDGRPFDMEVSTYNPTDKDSPPGPSKRGEGGEKVVNFVKPCGFPVVCVIQDPTQPDRKTEFPCCCLLP